MRLVLVLTILLFVGCATEPEIRTVYKTVEVPVAPDLPVIIMPVRPTLPLEDVRPTDEPGKIGKAYRISVDMLQGHVVELETLLEPYTIKQ